MSEGRAADKLSLPIEDQDLDGHRLVLDDLQGGLLRAPRDFVAERLDVKREVHQLVDLFGRNAMLVQVNFGHAAILQFRATAVKVGRPWGG